MAIFIEYSPDAKTEALLGELAASLRAVAAVAPILEMMMAAIDNLNTNMAKFADDFSKFADDFSKAVTALQAGVSTNNDAAIQAAADKLSAMDAQLQSLDSTATGLVSATPPAPATPPSGSTSSSGSPPIA
jgi:ABC-type transporter Mla subunit MlaD